MTIGFLQDRIDLVPVVNEFGNGHYFTSREVRPLACRVSEARGSASACSPSLTVGLLTRAASLKIELSTEFDYNNREARMSTKRIASQRIYSKWNRCLKLEIYSK